MSKPTATQKKTRSAALGFARGAARRKLTKGLARSLRPPPKLSLSEWADTYFYLSAESAAEPGKWRTLAYQKGIMDAITDPRVVRVSVMKSARIGYTKVLNAAVGYYVHQDPCPIMVVQPTVEDAEGYSKEEIAPMVRDVPVLTDLIGVEPPRRGRAKKKGKKRESSTKTSSETILLKKFPGGLIEMVGANSGRGFRRRSRRVVFFDEVDGYPGSAGNEGDPVKLGERRAEYYWNRKLVHGSTPLVAGTSRIEELYEAGDRRRYYVPCPHCGHMDHLRFNGEPATGNGHVMQFPKGPSDAHFVCGSKDCGARIDEVHKRAMIAAGEWRAEGEFNGHASFHLWAAYSLSPNATWSQLVEEFLEAKTDPLKLKTFVNTVLGETWQDRGEAPEWERLYGRRESYAIGSVPEGAIVLTAGVDVQKDRFYYEVVGWGANKESWSIDAGEIHGDTALEATWRKLDDELLARMYMGTDGAAHSIALLAVDSGFRTQMAYAWARGNPRAMTTKGVAGAAKPLIGTPSKVDVTVAGKKISRGHKMWPVGVDTAKSELYGWLRIGIGEDGEAPPGYCHFPEHPEWYFKQITAEHQVEARDKRTGRRKREWVVLPNRENHILDCRVYARAAAVRLGLDRMDAKQRAKAARRGPVRPTSPAAAPAPATPPVPAPQAAPAPQQRSSSWLPRTGGRWIPRRR